MNPGKIVAALRKKKVVTIQKKKNFKSLPNGPSLQIQYSIQSKVIFAMAR